MSALFVHVIPRHDPVNYYYPVSRLITIGERVINNTGDMVRQLRSLTMRTLPFYHGARAGQRVQAHKIARLIITGHGTPTTFRIGTDRINLATLQDANNEIRRKLQQIAPLFTNDAVVVLRQCRTGQSRPLLNALSRVLGNVRVQASEDAQIAFVPGLVGDVVECRLDTCREVE